MTPALTALSLPMKARIRTHCTSRSTCYLYLLIKASTRLADLTDVDFFLEPLSTTLFPGLPSGIEVHNGFAGEQAE